MKPGSKWLILLFCSMPVLLGACPKTNETGDIEEYPSYWDLSEEEKDALQRIRERRHEPRDKNAAYRLSEIKYGLNNDSETEREIIKLKTLVEGIRKNCQGVVDDYMRLYEDLSGNSDLESFYRDEEKARILGKYDVCSDILTRIEEKGID